MALSGLYNFIALLEIMNQDMFSITDRQRRQQWLAEQQDADWIPFEC